MRHRFFLPLLFALLLPLQAMAIAFDVEQLPDPTQEARARALMRELRCLVCQNQSIEDSNATLAKDLRKIVRQRIDAGDSDAEVRQFLVDRYGEWVLMRPPFKLTTLLLWLGPVLLLAVGGIALLIGIRRGKQVQQAQALSPEEEARIEALTRDP